MKPDLTPQAEDIGGAAMAADAVTDAWKDLEGIDHNEWPEWAEEIFTMVEDAEEKLRRARELIDTYAMDEEQGLMTFDMDGAHDIEQDDDE